MSDLETVLAANRAFYDAFETLELEKMEAVWLQAPHIVCIHPGWRRLCGWGPIMNSFDGIFDSAFEMKFEIRDPEVIVRGDLAIIVTREILTQRNYNGSSKSQVMATNIFERVGLKWFMVLHHGSPVASSMEDDEPPIQ
ncbi:MAG TPA: nuclear transport factor 2 family protein [Candidatus Binataceae bacterium]|jgi:ketosteroid isomerase-like protein